MMGIANGAKLNELLVESQKMIYAPPSREKSKQTMRSPMLDNTNKQQLGNAPISGTVQQFMGVGVVNSDEYMMTGPH
jgi:hypothetical protein